MKPVIPDYEWITYGERVKSRLFLIMIGSHMGSGFGLFCLYKSLDSFYG